MRNYEEAKLAFKTALNSILSAMKFFTLNERASDYVDCISDQCQIYAAVIQFEPSIDNRCKMNKRRIDLLEGVVQQLNPQHFLQHCRKLYYELGDVYTQQVSYKYEQHDAQYSSLINELKTMAQGKDERAAMEAAGQAKRDQIQNRFAAMKKINLLAIKAITCYHKFLSSFEFINESSITTRFAHVPFDKLEMFKLSGRIPDDQYVQPILMAYLNVGRLYLKLVSNQQQERIKHHKQSEQAFKTLDDYLKQNDDHRKQYFEDYHPQVQEMLRLIPGKIQNILSESVY